MKSESKRERERERGRERDEWFLGVESRAMILIVKSLSSRVGSFVFVPKNTICMYIYNNMYNA